MHQHSTRHPFNSYPVGESEAVGPLPTQSINWLLFMWGILLCVCW